MLVLSLVWRKLKLKPDQESWAENSDMEQANDDVEQRRRRWCCHCWCCRQIIEDVKAALATWEAAGVEASSQTWKL